MLEGKPIPWDSVVKDVPKEFRNDLDYIVSMIDWEANTDPEFKKHHYLRHLPVEDPEQTTEEGYEEKWVVYGSEHFSAKELTVFPKKSATIYDSAAYGLIVVQGYGTIGNMKAESPTMIRYGQVTDDELFVTIEASKDGVEVENGSNNENLVILKHFGPGNPNAPKL